MTGNENRALGIYRITVIGLGVVALAVTLACTDFSRIEAPFLIYSVFTVTLASRVGVRIPKVKGFISVSDTFIFLAI